MENERKCFCGKFFLIDKYKKDNHRFCSKSCARINQNRDNSGRFIANKK